jgi:hypothetical protein
MPALQLSAEEAEVLKEILQSYHDTLLMEIANTDTRDFRDRLKHRETVTRDVLQQLRGVTP